MKGEVNYFNQWIFLQFFVLFDKDVVVVCFLFLILFVFGEEVYGRCFCIFKICLGFDDGINLVWGDF